MAMDSPNTDLVGAMRNEFSAAKRWWSASIALNGLPAVGGIYLVFAPSGKLAIEAGLASLLVPVLAYFVREAASSHYSLGEKIRQLLLLRDGLGREISDSDLVDIRAEHTRFQSRDSAIVGSYYSSPHPVGNKRLAHILQESSFWTWKQAKTSARFFGALCAGGAILTLCLLYVALRTVWAQAPATPAPTTAALDGHALAKLLAVAFPFFAAGAFASLYGSYSSLSAAAHATFQSCTNYVKQSKKNDLTDLLLLVGKYNAGLAKAPPIFGFIYWWSSKRLNEAWSEVSAPNGGQ